jgi:hypothetical protein
MNVDIDAELRKRKDAEYKRMKAIRDAVTVPMVHVVPSKPEYRGVLRHGTTGVGFEAEGSAEWPDDQFTKRRVRDGSVTLEGKSKPDITGQERRATEDPMTDKQPGATEKPRANRTSAPAPELPEPPKP